MLAAHSVKEEPMSLINKCLLQVNEIIVMCLVCMHEEHIHIVQNDSQVEEYIGGVGKLLHS